CSHGSLSLGRPRRACYSAPNICSALPGADGERLCQLAPIVGLDAALMGRGAWLRRTNLWRNLTSPGTGSDLQKRYQPEGDVGEAKNKHLLPSPQSEEAEFDPALLTRGPGLSHRGVHSHESQELSCWSPGRWLLRRNVHAHDESWERASGPKSR